MCKPEIKHKKPSKQANKLLLLIKYRTKSLEKAGPKPPCQNVPQNVFT